VNTNKIVTGIKQNVCSMFNVHTARACTDSRRTLLADQWSIFSRYKILPVVCNTCNFASAPTTNKTRTWMVISFCGYSMLFTEVGNVGVATMGSHISIDLINLYRQHCRYRLNTARGLIFRHSRRIFWRVIDSLFSRWT